MAVLKLLALVLTALSLMPSAAHVFELPGKIGLDEDAYFTVQSIYRGWWMFSVPIFGAIVANGALGVALWRRRSGGAIFAAVAAGLIALSLVSFFAWVAPGNAETSSWTLRPENWDLLRRRWEYGHAAGAALVFLAFILICLAAITDTAKSRPAGSGQA